MIPSVVVRLHGRPTPHNSAPALASRPRRAWRTRREVSMLASLFPRAHARYTSLPILGGSLEGLCVWLHARGYPRDAIQRRMGAAASLVRMLRRRRVRSLGELTASALRSYAPPPRWSGSPPRGALVRSITQYLEERGELVPTLPTPTQRQLPTTAATSSTSVAFATLRSRCTPPRSPSSCCSLTTTSVRGCTIFGSPTSRRS